jgi:hypothetical protein
MEEGNEEEADGIRHSSAGGYIWRIEESDYISNRRDQVQNEVSGEGGWDE